MKFSKYKTSDIKGIMQLFTNVFSDSEGESEGLVIGNLTYDLMTTSNKNDIYVFIAIEDKKIIGSVIFSRIRFEKSDIIAFILSPMAIDTKYHNQGIGQKLINFAIDSLKENQIELLFTYGDPKFYCKVGFLVIKESIIKAPLKLTYPEGWLCQSLVDDKIKAIYGNSHCVTALQKQQYW